MSWIDVGKRMVWLGRAVSVCRVECRQQNGRAAGKWRSSTLTLRAGTWEGTACFLCFWLELRLAGPVKIQSVPVVSCVCWRARNSKDLELPSNLQAPVQCELLSNETLLLARLLFLVPSHLLYRHSHRHIFPFLPRLTLPNSHFTRLRKWRLLLPPPAALSTATSSST